MGNAGSALHRLGRHVAAEQDAEIEKMAPDHRERERLLATLNGRAVTGHPTLAPKAAEARRPPSRRALVWRGAALTAAAVLTTWALVVAFSQQPLSFRVGAGETAHAGVPGAFLTASSGAPLPVVFSDGTHLQITPGSTIRVASVDEDGGRVVLESGALDVAVVHRDTSRWLVDGGPFQVRVTGTRFTVTWDHTAERFTVALAEGAVSVSGPVVGEGLTMRAGETLRVLRAEGRFELTRGERPLEAALSGEPKIEAPPASAAETSEPRPGPRPPAASRTTSVPSAPAPSFRDLVRAGKYEEALAAAERDGVSRLLEQGSAGDLRDLGDAARLAGKPGRAVEAFTALRRRFPSSEESAQAAFRMGILAFDARGAHAEAARWFATYLAERPSGSLAREAAGRLIEAHERAGDRAGAREAARAYLRSYPDGAHARLARSVLGAREGE